MDQLYTISILPESGTAPHIIADVTGTVATMYGLLKYAVRVPHITLYGPFTLKRGHKIQEVMNVIEDAGNKFPYLPYSVRGWKKLRSRGLGEVIAHQVIASPELEEFYNSLHKGLAPVVTSRKWQDTHPSTGHLHISVLHGMYNSDRIGRVWNDLISNPSIPPLDLDLEALRITLNSETFQKAYDLPRRLWLSGDRTFSGIEWEKTFSHYLIAKQEHDYRV